VLDWCLLSEATIQKDGLSATRHNNANTLVAILLVTLAAVQHYYVCDNVKCGETFSIVTRLQWAKREVDPRA
jgi:hypothetical protein